MNKYVKYGLIGILLVALGFGAGKYSKPAQVESKVESKQETKIVEDKKENKNVVIITKKITRKDGTIEEESRIEDKTITDTNTKTEQVIESKSETIVKRDIGLNLGLLAVKDLDKLSNKTEYAFTIKKRVFSAVTINGLVTTDKKVGVGLGWDF